MKKIKKESNISAIDKFLNNIKKELEELTDISYDELAEMDLSEASKLIKKKRRIKHPFERRGPVEWGENFKK